MVFIQDIDLKMPTDQQTQLNQAHNPWDTSTFEDQTVNNTTEQRSKIRC